MERTHSNSVPRLDEEEFLEMSVAELRKHLKQLGVSVEDYPTHRTKLAEIRDHAIDMVYSEFQHHHSECQGGDYDPMHPNETVEEFLDHE